MKKKEVKWPTLTVPCPEQLERALLLYWDDVLKPMKGDHPVDVKRQKRYRAAIKVLLEFFEDD